MSGFLVVIGDCREVMAAMEPESVDAIVTDPPYGLEFMGKEWDKLRSDVGGRDDLKPSEQHFNQSADPNATIGAWKTGSPRPASYTPNKNPRCRKCHRLKHDHEKGRCKCETPEWDLRKSEYGYAMQWWHESWAVEAHRVLKPGGHLLAFGGSRTYHRMACAVEDAGFEIRDQIMWLYGSGFPKSLDVSKAIDKTAGAEREVIGESPYAARRPNPMAGTIYGYNEQGFDPSADLSITAPATDLARRWSGWGTALKPAHEPIVVARKPLIGTVAANVEKYGTGAINVDGCRIPCEPILTSRNTALGVMNDDGWTPKPATFENNPSGRWPPNVVLGCACDGPQHDAGCAVRMLDEQSGERPAGVAVRRNGMSAASIWGSGNTDPAADMGYADFGGASRFLYTAKASREERNSGGVPSLHPTMKPVALMRWLVRLVTPPGGLVLDPFAGSGSTGVACSIEGFRFIGIEQDREYAAIAQKRIHAAPLSLFGVASEEEA